MADRDRCPVAVVCDSIHGMTGTGVGRGPDLFREGDFPICTLTFVRDLPPAELLKRMGVAPETLALRDAADLVDDFGDDLFDDEEPAVTSGIDGSWAWARRPWCCTTTRSRCAGSRTRWAARSSSTSTRSTPLGSFPGRSRPCTASWHW
ncbi:hypothetical protein GCM10011578_014650 [Streptomyces fuscichromogenes]|uniref:Uncharacterized protein n=1 Tax=Streptomyces fuscichromogenes TaxID=1324013 RepID=A0A917UHK8_9ACTN|nr:hypothetical protein GCM10011578_014650 [Streptomyces fuscichromogenes]